MTFYLFFDHESKNEAYKIVTDTNLTTSKWYPTLDQVLSIPFSEYRTTFESATLSEFFFLFTCLGEFSQIPTRESHPELFL